MNENTTHINWYPGHMAKAIRQMKEQLSLVDIVIEIRDARIPFASANPVLKELANNKPVLIILNKVDMADDKYNQYYGDVFKHYLLANSLNENITSKVVNKVKEILKDKLDKAKARGIKKKVLRAMVVGVPNVGKSTFINNIVNKKITKTENRPGVTRSLQWIRINEDVELLDTPGVLWPKIDNQNDAILLALLGSINDNVVDTTELAKYGLNYIKNHYPGVLNNRYGINEENDDLLKQIGENKKLFNNNGDIDYHRLVELVLKDIRNAKIGKITYQDVREYI